MRFPEGRRRLEDHAFVTEAYLRADNVSVLSDYVCYYHLERDDASNAGFQRFEPVGYFQNLREALDVDRAVKSLGLHRLTPADAAVSDAETLTVALPLYVPDSTEVTVRPAGASGRTVDGPAVLTPADGVHALLAADLPLRELRGALWRTELRLAGGRILKLPLLLRVGRAPGAVAVVRPSPPGMLRRLLRSARRLLGGVPGTRTTTTTRKA